MRSLSGSLHGLVADAFDQDQNALLHLLSLLATLSHFLLHLLEHFSQHFVELSLGVTVFFT
jgi:hypothetical protein